MNYSDIEYKSNNNFISAKNKTREICFKYQYLKIFFNRLKFFIFFFFQYKEYPRLFNLVHLTIFISYNREFFPFCPIELIRGLPA